MTTTITTPEEKTAQEIFKRMTNSFTTLFEDHYSHVEELMKTKEWCIFSAQEFALFEIQLGISNFKCKDSINFQLVIPIVENVLLTLHQMITLAGMHFVEYEEFCKPLKASLELCVYNALKSDVFLSEMREILAKKKSLHKSQFEY